MSGAHRQDILKKVFISVWAMITMVLLFTVILLAKEMLAQGKDPLATVRTESLVAQEAGESAPKAPAEMQDVVLYYCSQDGQSLAPEIRSIEKGATTADNCRAALNLLIAGPRDILLPVLPPSLKVNAVYLLEDGELVVDLSRELREQTRFSSTSSEALSIFSIVTSLSHQGLQVAGQTAVQRVRILMEGSQPQEPYPSHIDLSEPLRPDPAWIESGQDRLAHGA